MTDFFKYPERRHFKRVDADLNVFVTIDGRQIQTTTSNISCGGMFVPMRQPQVSEKSEVKILLHLPDDRKPVTLQGEVNRVYDTSPEETGLAITFKGLYDDNVHAIDRFIKNKVH